MDLSKKTKAELFIKLIRLKYQIKHAFGFHKLCLMIQHDKYLKEYTSR